MEEKSLIILKKISLEQNNNVENDNKEIDKNLESVLYYDRYSKRIFDINQNGIKIYNRKAKNLKANILINIRKESLLSIVADKELNYIICLLINKEKDKNIYKTKLILINTLKRIIFEQIEDNFYYMLGMFFIGKINNYIDFDNNQNELYDFCLVHCDKIVFYGIESKNKREECAKKLLTLNTSGSILIKDFSYDFKHKILCIVKTDLSISFLILTNRKNYKNMITPKIEYIKTLKEKVSLMGMFRKASEDQKRIIKEHYDNLDKYTETQFYLETIYNSLYLICLCYEDNKIYIHKLENLNTIGTLLNIDYTEHVHCSSLQVIDNLIIVHNFITKLIVVIDIKSKVPILRSFKVDFPYHKNLHINGEILEERKVVNKNRLISVYGGTLYNISFNGKSYDQITDFDFQKRKDKNKELKEKNINIDKDKEMNRYDVLVNLLHRKGSNNLILNILYRLILNEDEKPYYIIKFFQELVSLDNQAKEKVEIISDKKLVKKEISEMNMPYEVPRPFNIIKAKKNYIKQIDILINLFDKFIKENEEKKIEFNDKLILRIIFFMTQFYCQINIQKMELKLIYHKILLNYLKILKQREKIIPYIIQKNIPDSWEIGEYLLELSMNKNDIYYKVYENLGLKMLSKLKKHEIIIDFLFKKGNVVKAMNYINQIFSQLEPKQVDNIFKNNKNIFEEKKDLVLNYLK